jgi:hypothetical protein
MVKTEAKAPANKQAFQKKNNFFRDESVLVPENQPDIQPFFNPDPLGRASDDSKPFFSAPAIQPKLTIGKPGDKYEQEADSVAENVVKKTSRPENTGIQQNTTTSFTNTSHISKIQLKTEETTIGPNLQKKPIFESSTELTSAKSIQAKPLNTIKNSQPNETTNEDSILEKKEEKDEETQINKKAIFESSDAPEENTKNEPVQTKLIQAKGDPGSTPGNIEGHLSSEKSHGTPLPDKTRQQMETSFGADFGNVRIHTGSPAIQLSNELNAQAFTHGSDIYFNDGKYNPDTQDGKRLLAHELTHTVQQGGSLRMKEFVNLAPEMIQAFGFVDLIPDWIKSRARHVPGYTLFTVIISYDPLFDRPVERTPINVLEGLMGLVPFGTAIFDKLREYGIIQQVFEWVESQLNSLNLTTQGLLNLLEEAWNEMEFPYTDAIDIVSNKLHQLLQRVETFANSLVSRIMQWIKDALVGVAEPYLNENRAWSLIKKIIKFDPLKNEEVSATTVEILSDFLLLIGKQTELEQMRERGTLQETADWLDTQIGTFMSLLGELRALITSAWDAIQPANLPNIVENLQSLAVRAGSFLQRVWDFAITVASKVLELIKTSLLEWLKSFANDIPGYHLLTVILGKDIFTNEVVPRTVENIIKGFMSLLPGGDEQFNQMQETGVIPQAAQKIEALMGSLGISWEFVVSLFTDLWNSFTINDLLNPIPAFQRIVDKFAEPISRLFNFVIDVILIVIELVLQMMNFPFDIIRSIMNNAMAAFEDIKRDPIGFLINMLEAVKLGFSHFFDNILTHLADGLADWFFGQLEDAGITRPPDLSLGSILNLVLQVLGISMDRIWEKLADRIGQENVDRIRGAIDRLSGIWTFIKDVQERGMVAIWEYIQGQISNLWNMILEQATNWIMEQVINRVVTKLLSMLDPTGIMAVVNSFIAFFNAIQSAIEYFREILQIIDDYVSTIAAVARGEVEPGAAKLEQGLANAIPIAIGFLANQVGLRRIASRIAEIISTIRGYVDQALDWLLDRAVAGGRALLARITGEGGEETGTASPETQQQIQTGLNAIETAEGPFLESGEITEEHATQVATRVRQQNSIFTELHVVDGGTSWNYAYRAGGNVQGVKITSGTGRAPVIQRATKKTNAFPVEDEGIRAEVLKIKEHADFKDKTFKIQDLKNYLASNYENMSPRTGDRRIADMKRLALLFVSESARAGTADSNKDASFEQDLLSPRVISPVTNRSKYGYRNPEKDSAKGLIIMKKGLLREAKYGYTPAKENDLDYLKTTARYKDKKHDMIISWKDADLGHKSVSAREHWNDGGGNGSMNKPGHTQTKSNNTEWNQNTDNYHGPEEKHENRGDNEGHYRVPGPNNDPPSHRMWWDPTHDDYQG